MQEQTKQISLAPINDYSLASNELAIRLGEFLDWVRQEQAGGSGKNTIRMTKQKLLHLRQAIRLVKREIKPLAQLFADLPKTGVFDRGSDKSITFTQK